MKNEMINDPMHSITNESRNIRPAPRPAAAVAGDVHRRDGGRRFGARHQSGGSRQGRLHAAGWLRTGGPAADLLLRPGESHRVAERRLGARRMGGPAQPVVGRPVPGGDRRLHVAEALRPGRQGRHQAARNGTGADHGAGRGVRRRAGSWPDGNRLPAAHQPAVHQPAGQPDGAQHVRGVHIDGRGGPGLLHRWVHHEDESPPVRELRLDVEHRGWDRQSRRRDLRRRNVGFRQERRVHPHGRAICRPTSSTRSTWTASIRSR